MRFVIYTTIISLIIIACRSGKVVTESQDTGSDTGAWWDWQDSDTDETDTQEDEEEPKNDTADKPDDDYQECAPDFDPQEPCVGDWIETICVVDGVIWWCDNGVWKNEDEKPEN